MARVAAAASATALVLVASAGPAAAASKLTNGHGLSSCAVSGTLSFDPPLKTGATGTSAIMISLGLSGCGGGDFSVPSKTITTGTGTSIGKHPRTVPAGCVVPGISPGADSGSTSLPSLRLQLTWSQTNGKTPKSSFTLRNGVSTWTGANGPSFVPSATQVLAFSGVKNAGGAFATPASNLRAVRLTLSADQDYGAQVTDATSGCASSVGLAQITVQGTLLLP